MPEGSVRRALGRARRCVAARRPRPAQNLGRRSWRAQAIRREPRGRTLTQMGDERESGTVKILDETLREKEQEEKAEIKRLKNVSYVF